MSSADPPPLSPHRDPGDAWVEAADGTRYWGRFGAAGLLAWDARRGVLLQHRAAWSHHGDTWGIPGGALHAGESPYHGALREAREEAGVRADDVAPLAAVVADRKVWSYTTLVATVTAPFEPVAGDAESIALAWVALDDVAALPLHPAFGHAWPQLRALLRPRPTLVVDAANVIGSVPDGWWKDRAGAAERWASRMSVLALEGLPGEDLGFPAARVWPRVVMVVEGAARGIAAPAGVEVVNAPGAGDDAIVGAAQAAADGPVTVVTADRGLRARLPRGATAVGPRWLRDRLG